MQLVTPPAELIPLPEAKAWLRVDGMEEDALIGGLLAAATAHLDGWTGVLGRALGEQVWEISLDAWPAERVAALRASMEVWLMQQGRGDRESAQGAERAGATLATTLASEDGRALIDRCTV